MTDPLVPAVLAFRDNGTPYSPLHDDIYHSAVGGLAQAEYVFLKGNDLPARWQNRRTFTVLETGFGIGINFLMTWAAWRTDPARCERLHFVSTEKHPVSQAGFDLQKVGGFGWKRAMLVGRFAPRYRVRRHEPPLPLPVDERHAIVIGTGLAGSAAIDRLTARGWRVTSLERHAAVARDASGNPAGVFHPMMSRDDSVASRITRAGFLYALQRWSSLARSGHPP